MTPKTSGSLHKARAVYSLTTVLFFMAVFLLLVITNMQKALNHDEHMYVAAGDLIASRSLLPYKDFNFFQMPNLELLYAGLFQGANHLLLAARLFNTLCSTLSLGILFYTVSNLLPSAHPLIRFSISAGSVVLLISNSVFIYTSGLAWNHDLPVLFALSAAAFFCRNANQPCTTRGLFFTGILVGLAIGARLSFAPIIVPFVGATLLLPGIAQIQKRPLLSCSFLVGALVALTPTLMLFALAPARFAFDNLRYHQLNEAYWQQLGYTNAMTFLGKLAYLRDVISEPATLALLSAVLLLLIATAIRASHTKLPGYSKFAFILSLLPFLLIGALAPTPTWYQYFYALAPFLVLAIINGIALLYSDVKLRISALAAFGLLTLLCAASGVPAYLRLNQSLSTDNWVPTTTHRVGLEIKRAVGNEKVLTLSPLFPLEGGSGIYEALATGPFAWRMARLLPDQERKKLDLISPDNLDDFLRGRPPKAILVGSETALEEPLIKYAQEHSYKPEKLSNGTTLWLSP